MANRLASKVGMDWCHLWTIWKGPWCCRRIVCDRERDCKDPWPRTTSSTHLWMDQPQGSRRYVIVCRQHDWSNRSIGLGASRNPTTLGGEIQTKQGDRVRYRHELGQPRWRIWTSCGKGFRCWIIGWWIKQKATSAGRGCSRRHANGCSWGRNDGSSHRCYLQAPRITCPNQVDWWRSMGKPAQCWCDCRTNSSNDRPTLSNASVDRLQALPWRNENQCSYNTQCRGFERFEPGREISSFLSCGCAWAVWVECHKDRERHTAVCKRSRLEP